MSKEDQDWESSSESNWDPPPADASAGGGDGGGMDMSALQGGDVEEHEKRDAELSGPLVLIRFDLPDGESEQESFPHAKTLVMDLKSWVEQKRQIPYEKISLFAGEKHLLDPLSLNDIPQLKTGGVTNEVSVKVA
eukprot:Hpha_TRINITY_DN9909_c1_g1::TRINITY_DN9909_c1_g1_i1::g.140546::m.140546